MLYPHLVDYFPAVVVLPAIPPLNPPDGEVILGRDVRKFYASWDRRDPDGVRGCILS